MDLAVIIVINKKTKQKKWNEKSKYVDCDERGSQEKQQRSHGQNFTVIGLVVEPITDTAKKVLLSNIFPLYNLTLQQNTAVLLYLPPYLDPSFSEVNFSVTYKMYPNLGLTHERF